MRLVNGNVVDDDKPVFTRKYEKQLDAAFENDREAYVLLDLINAEFQSDPSSVACFDLRIVERVRLCVEKRKKDPRVF